MNARRSIGSKAIGILTVLLLFGTGSRTAWGQTVQRIGPAYASLMTVDSHVDSLRISGFVVDAQTGMPIQAAIVAAGSRGGLTDERGWFRFGLPRSYDGTEVTVERLGHRNVNLVANGPEVQAFYFQNVDVGPCEAVATQGFPPSQPGQIILELRNLQNGQAVSGGLELAIVPFGSGERSHMQVIAPNGLLEVPIDQPGPYELDIRAPGFEPLVMRPILVGASSCAPNGVTGVRKVVWLTPQS